MGSVNFSVGNLDSKSSDFAGESNIFITYCFVQIYAFAENLIQFQ
jgi:hypothetical protein